MSLIGNPLSARHPALPALGLGLGAGAVGLGGLLALLDPAAGWADTALALALYGGAALLLVAGLGCHPHARLGAANVITLGRLVLTCALAAYLAAPLALRDPATGWTVAALCVVALALDGVDGWAARRSGLSSAFGARFDMETDAFLGAVLALLVWLSGKAGVWVLALGGLRYLWIAGGLVMPWLSAPLPESLRRKTVCVIQIAALAALVSPALVPPLSGPVAAMATALLVWSFAVDGLWLWRRR